jgi:hypothetical protein
MGRFDNDFKNGVLVTAPEFPDDSESGTRRRSKRSSWADAR